MQEQVANHFQQELMDTERNQYLNLMSGDIESAQRAEIKKIALVQNAYTVMNELNKKERELIRFRLSQSKTIKCTYCDHKGQSMVEETTSILTYLFGAIFIIMTWDYTGSYTYFFFFTLFVLPILAGIFRIQTHSCSNCLNEVKQQSIFEHLDMEDNIVEVQIASFAMIIKRRTLIYTFLVIVVLFLVQIVFQIQLANRLDIHDPLQDFVADTMHLNNRKPDPQLTWEVFQQATTGRTYK